MSAFWNVLDMAHNIANQIWKHSLAQNMTPAVEETLNGSLLYKLGISWLPTQAPAFYINSRQVKILHTPQSFYNLLLEQIQKANNRIVLSSLYLGTGVLEQNLVNVLQKRLGESSGLRVKILLDCTRGSRGNINSRKMLLPLLNSHGNSCLVSLYQTAAIHRPVHSFLPTKYKEIIGLHHIKIYLFDDNFILTGANLSHDYFTNRQDRYIFIEGSRELADFVEGLVDKVSEFSFHLKGNDCLTYGNKFPPQRERESFNFAASSSIRNYYESFINNGKMSEGTNDTVIFPLLEMGPFGIHTDSEVTMTILKNCGEESDVYLTTGYFNLTNSYANTIIEKSMANYKILMAHPKTNGFYKASFPAGGIPEAYTHLASAFLKKVIHSQQSHRIKMFEYLRNNWTYHSKGLWFNTFDNELPFITMIGSPNFGERSVNHDLECQFLLATADEKLQYDLLQERKTLYNYSHPFGEDTWMQPDRKIPYWVKGVVMFFKSYL